LKLKCDEPLSNVAFNFQRAPLHPGTTTSRRTGRRLLRVLLVVGRCSLTVSNPVLIESAAWFQSTRLKLKYDQLLSSFAFKFNLRHCMAEDHSTSQAAMRRVIINAGMLCDVAGRCRSPVSKYVLNAPTVSALETKILSTAFKFCFEIQLAPLQRGRQRRGGADRDRARVVPPRWGGAG
jgi:hypothetical protein